MNWLHCLKPEPIIHRDLKPPNVLVKSFAFLAPPPRCTLERALTDDTTDDTRQITREGNVKVCDFGLSCAKEKFDPKGPLKDKAVGTPVYMVPCLTHRTQPHARNRTHHRTHAAARTNVWYRRQRFCAVFPRARNPTSTRMACCSGYHTFLPRSVCSTATFLTQTFAFLFPFLSLSIRPFLSTRQELFARQGKPFAHMNSFQLFCETVVGRPTHLIITVIVTNVTHSTTFHSFRWVACVKPRSRRAAAHSRQRSRQRGQAHPRLLAQGPLRQAELRRDPDPLGRHHCRQHHPGRGRPCALEAASRTRTRTPSISLSSPIAENVWNALRFLGHWADGAFIDRYALQDAEHLPWMVEWDNFILAFGEHMNMKPTALSPDSTMVQCAKLILGTSFSHRTRTTAHAHHAGAPTHLSRCSGGQQGHHDERHQQEVRCHS